ncbi:MULTISPECIES: YegS/Rv2252/BmrU family lipid kinase [Porcipelethomonas]|jgi:lipid kinase, YegS/Rv2252/BmrU family|uniref:diacylglycerol/lipid kinase family protein n=1 Tax=Porcipelethomonas TaxID=2981643 RepID=UPI0008209892|nr:YegS/Rv2252/BmrU family lipid kinase [Porcipelethomonas ammoniilytica]MCU6719775.1 YegS/Rv2252/BmrU family lipid kinase [Porcipelethomonas ammoniilytica]OLA71050.1 MAG: lipid kinase [Ruminococcus sp. 37_24]SCI91959.1 Diacylglycerol kinase [uncultured Ruminococcus sp.]
MKKLYFILNLQSGKATISSKLAVVIDMFTKAGYEVTARPTQERMDACAAAKYACGQGFDLIVCSGGDGTLNEVIQGVMRSEKKLPIGYIPAGSTNDFARGVGIPRNIIDAVQWIIDGKKYPCDIGSFNDKFFTYIAAFGAFTEVTYETSQQVKNVLGHVAYVLNGISRLKNIKSYHMKITYDDEIIEDNYIFGMVTNSSSVAGLLSLNDFLLDDGLYEVTLIKTPGNPLDLQRIIHSLLNIDIDIDTAYIKSFRTSKIRFECDDELQWTIDGEFGGAYKTVDVCNNKQAIELMADR